MMNRQLWFNRDGEPIDAMTANTLLSDRDYARVGLTRVTSSTSPAVDFKISTVWLGVNHNWDDGPPILFETMVFGGGEEQDQTQWRWTTEQEAREGHAALVATVAASVPDDVVTDLKEWPATEETAPADDAEPVVGLHVHRWTKWENGTATYDSPLFPKLGEWNEAVQTRRCTKCDKTQLRKLT